MAKVLCTCSCGRYVSRSTKQNHLKGRGTTALRATVLAETESLKMLAGQPQKLQKNRGSNKRTSINPDEGSSRKRFKASYFEARPEPDKSSTFPMDEFEASPVPEVPSAHTDPLPAVVIQSNRAAEPVGTIGIITAKEVKLKTTMMTRMETMTTRKTMTRTR